MVQRLVPEPNWDPTCYSFSSLGQFEKQLKQMASRFSAGALYKNLRPACTQVPRHDLPNGNHVVHPSSDENPSPQFSLKSYNMDCRTPARQYTAATQQNKGVYKRAPLKSVRNLQRNMSDAALGEDGLIRGTAGPVVKTVDSEWVAQFEPGVYITFVSFPDGFNELKRIKFSRNIFSKLEAESWWTQNCTLVRELYNVRPPSSTADEDRFSSGYATPDAHSTRSPCQSFNGDYSLTRKKSTADTRSHGSRRSESGNSEWVEQDEPGVYLTIIYVPGVGKQLRRVRFSRDKFSESEATAWWGANRQRIFSQYIGKMSAFQEK